MISVKGALEIHKILIEQFSGKYGLRDLALLESALQRPFQTFDGAELYSTPIQKCAAYMELVRTLIAYTTKTQCYEKNISNCYMFFNPLRM